MRPFVFFPQAMAGSDSLLVQHGLEGMIDHGGEPSQWAAVLTGGPGPGAGVACWWKTGGVLWRGPQESFEWVPIPGSPAWIGYDRDRMPTPEELARKEQQHGQFVELGDGQAWFVPEARSLPRRRVLRRDGLQYEVVDRFRTFFEAAYNDILPMLAEGKTEYSTDQLFAYASRALGINYCVAPAICDLLGLWTDASLAATLKVTVALEAMVAELEAAKKNGTRPEELNPCGG